VKVFQAKTIIHTLSDSILSKNKEITSLATLNLSGFKSFAIIEYETSKTICISIQFLLFFSKIFSFTGLEKIEIKITNIKKINI
jgi:hypothetical protein